jgi:3'(2'), 5'-bisphosphate nucleotidase
LPAHWHAEVHAACRAAGDVILQLRAALPATERKADGSLVSNADRAASLLIGERLRALDASIPVICEEALHDAAHAVRFWLVDPLDGTREFLRGSDVFTVNIALVEDGSAVFGAVYLPATGRFYCGETGIGAWRDGVALQARRSNSQDVLRVLVSPGQEEAIRQQHGAALQQRYPAMSIDAVAGAVKFCLLAAGEADLYPRYNPSCAWDTAAGQAILEAAGGAVLDCSGAPLRYRQTPGWYNPGFLAVADNSIDWTRLLGN